MLGSIVKKTKTEYFKSMLQLCEEKKNLKCGAAFLVPRGLMTTESNYRETSV